MMLRDHFYKILATEKQGINSCRTIVNINQQSPLFQGHFPSVPIVPGVCMMQMIKEQLEDLLQRSLRLSRAANIKFLSVINPLENQELVLEILYTASDDGTITAEGTISFHDKIFFKIAKAVYK